MSRVTTDTSSFPPEMNLATALAAGGGLSVLATKAFADPNSGYPRGLRLSAALDEQASGHFTLASALTVTGSAASAAEKAIEKMRDVAAEIVRNVAVLRDSATSTVEKDMHRVAMEQNLDRLDQILEEANVSGINLLDARFSDGLSLDIASGGLSDLGKTPKQDATGKDMRFDYSPARLVYQKTDIKKALRALRNIELETIQKTEENLNTNESISTVEAFRNTLDQADASLKSFKAGLGKTALEKITVTLTENNPDASKYPAGDARQIAARLAQQLEGNNYSITAGKSARYFSLFA